MLHNIIRLGLESICDRCGAKNWHGLDEVDYSVKCERCLKNYDFPQANLKPQNENWKYRVIGPYAVPDYARGSYAALLTINVLRTLSKPVYSRAVNYSTALDISSDKHKCEIDFAMWISHDLLGEHSDPRLVIGESKSFGDEAIKAKDISQLKIAASLLPKAILVVSVLKDSFSSSEKRLLTKFVAWAKGPDMHRPKRLVILLTGTELFADNIGLEWKKKGGRYKQYDKSDPAKSFEALSDATQKIYLN